ncbi:hypothetical protein BDA99DRAFT_561512 [Phascolomyces articulosus]|uniref:Uncharacterized protein n=1 Tax=Phascolomyces articulosus TaxID=60185 RepID=A0AAD5K9Y8_9FUNG|nr:hypothetical protein BDA99DRAFT_561512 [Phascolomyces articulosus]
MPSRPNKYSKISIEVRNQLITRTIINNERLPTVRKELKIAKSTSHAIIKNFRVNGQVAPKPRGGSHPNKILEKHLTFIHDTIREHKNQKIKITLAILKSKLESHFPGFTISTMTISRYIKSDIAPLTLKQLTTFPRDAPNPNNSQSSA